MSARGGLEDLGGYLRDCVDRGEIPGAAWALAGPDGLLAEGAIGRAAVVPREIEATTTTLYDLASLTKPLVTSFVYLRVRRELGLAPDRPASQFLPEIDRIDKREIALRHLLTHTSGLPAWVPFYTRGNSIEEYLAQIREISPEARPGALVVYSDLGYIMMGEILRRAAGMTLDRLARETVFDPLGLSDTMFNPPPDVRHRVAATEDSCQYETKLAGERARGYRGFRSGIIRGEVHDQNAWAAGGVAGHAGLFSTAKEAATIALEYLGGSAPAKGLLDDEAVRLATRDQTPDLTEARTFAFRIASRGETAAGSALPVSSFGHNGFTGTSIWIDPVRPRVYVLLTNRIHPVVPETSGRPGMLEVRRGFHEVASRV